MLSVILSITMSLHIQKVFALKCVTLRYLMIMYNPKENIHLCIMVKRGQTMKYCNFCKKKVADHKVAMAQICNSCAVGQAGDSWCDFCKKTTRTSIAFICSDCAVGRIGDSWCDFCKKTTNTKPAQICNKC